jgi:hypothetical protein
MIDTDKYEGHTEGPWESEEWDEGQILGPILERHRNNHSIVAVVGDGWWGDMMPECNANLRLMTDAPLLLAEVEQLYEEKEAMLKHITDLEAALKKAVEMWDEETPLFDFELMITGIKEQFAYLFDLDDGYEPPEHMTADDFNEMHSGPYQPDDSGYMDGDY